jgi:hypothetical protein
MSKKLIAVAAAAALALTGLVGVAPASASPTITYDGAAQNAGLTAAAPIVVNVPSQNVLRNAGGTSATTSGSVIRVDIDSPLTNNTIRVTATGAVKLLTTAQFSVTANRTAQFGSQSIDVVGSEAAGLAGFYVYTTSTGVGTFSVTDAGTTIVRHIQGATTIDNAYNLEFTAPSTADVSGTLLITGSITDAFGNKIEGLTATAGQVPATLTVTRFGSASVLASTDAGKWKEGTTAATAGIYTFAVTTSATAGTGIVGLTIAPVAITALGTPKSSVLLQFSTASLSTQVTNLTAQVAALTAQLQASVTKAKYNKLAKRWNRANPSKKVKLQK